MGRKQGLTAAYDVADAEHVRDGTKAHWKAMQLVGAEAEELKVFEANLSEAKKLEASEGAEVSVDEFRQDLKDLVGDFRSAGDLVADGFNGLDPIAQRDLKLAGKFPTTDAALATYARAIIAPMKQYSVKLAKRGFTKDQQAQVGELAVTFSKAIEAKPVTSSQRKKATVDRRNIFVKLRQNTRYFRRLGRRALRLSNDRTDFDRVKVEKAAKKKAKTEETPKKPE